MTIRIKVSGSMIDEIECDTVREASQIVRELRGRPRTQASGPDDPHPTFGEQRKRQVIEYLREHGPGVRNQILKALDISPSASTPLFSDSRFEILSDFNVWLAGEPLPDGYDLGDDEEADEPEESEDEPDDEVDDDKRDDPAELDEQDKGRGRPRDRDREVKVSELLAQGLKVSQVAKQLGIHRNCVYAIKNRLENGDDDEPPESDDATDVDDEPAPPPKPDSRRWRNPDSEGETPAHFNGQVAVKPKLIEALEQYPDGLGVSAIAELTGLHIDRVRAGLLNHRGKAFSRDDAGIWTLLDKPLGTSSAKPSTKSPTDKSKWHSMVTALLKSDQPLELKDIARIAKIPEADLFKLLADEEEFERDSDRMYWLAK